MDRRIQRNNRREVLPIPPIQIRPGYMFHTPTTNLFHGLDDHVIDLFDSAIHLPQTSRSRPTSSSSRPETPPSPNRAVITVSPPRRTRANRSRRHTPLQGRALRSEWTTLRSMIDDDMVVSIADLEDFHKTTLLIGARYVKEFRVVQRIGEEGDSALNVERALGQWWDRALRELDDMGADMMRRAREKTVTEAVLELERDVDKLKDGR